MKFKVGTKWKLSPDNKNPYFGCELEITKACLEGPAMHIDFKVIKGNGIYNVGQLDGWSYSINEESKRFGERLIQIDRNLTYGKIKELLGQTK